MAGRDSASGMMKRWASIAAIASIAQPRTQDMSTAPGASAYNDTAATPRPAARVAEPDALPIQPLKLSLQSILLAERKVMGPARRPARRYRRIEAYAGPRGL